MLTTKHRRPYEGCSDDMRQPIGVKSMLVVSGRPDLTSGTRLNKTQKLCPRPTVPVRNHAWPRSFEALIAIWKPGSSSSQITSKRICPTSSRGLLYTLNSCQPLPALICIKRSFEAEMPVSDVHGRASPLRNHDVGRYTWRMGVALFPRFKQEVFCCDLVAHARGSGA